MFVCCVLDFGLDIPGGSGGIPFGDSGRNPIYSSGTNVEMLVLAIVNLLKV